MCASDRKKALEHFSNRKVPVVSDSFTEAGDISVADCFEIARLICHGYKEGGFGHVAIVYTNFVNMMVQEPKFIPNFAAAGYEVTASEGCT